MSQNENSRLGASIPKAAGDGTSRTLDGESTSEDWPHQAAVQLRRRREHARRSGDGTDPWHGTPFPPISRNVIAARRAWYHLRDHSLLSETSVDVLQEAV